MATPYHHALSSVKRWGGCVDDYLDIHNWFDASKNDHGDFRHRALRHHTQGIFECERLFGVTITNSAGKVVPTRLIGEQHVREDVGFLPTVSDWLSRISPLPWMNKPMPVDEMFRQSEYAAHTADVNNGTPGATGKGSDDGAKVPAADTGSGTTVTADPQRS